MADAKEGPQLFSQGFRSCSPILVDSERQQQLDQEACAKHAKEVAKKEAEDKKQREREAAAKKVEVSASS